MEKTKSLIEISHLSAAYDGKTVLRDVNLTVYNRDFLGLIGPNGGGKTTLVKCILGLLQPSAGKIVRHTCRPGVSGKFRMGYLPQYTRIDRQFPITVGEVVLSGLAGSKPILSRYTPDDRDKARRAMARMGLEGLDNRPIGALSGGQLQRALLGRAVVSDPEVLILDEPGTYLDRRSETRLYELLADLNQDCAIILVSHDIRTVLRKVKSVACVHGTLDYHSAADVTSERLERLFESASRTEAAATNVAFQSTATPLETASDSESR